MPAPKTDYTTPDLLDFNPVAPTADGQVPIWSVAQGRYNPGAQGGKYLGALQFSGINGCHLTHGMFWPAVGWDLGKFFFWEFWTCPALPGYFITDGYGGAHSILAGYSGVPGPITGNIFANSALQSFGGRYNTAIGEWGHDAVCYNAADLLFRVYKQGILDDMAVAPASRLSQDRGGGAGVLHIGGSNHSMYGGKIASARGFDRGYNPFTSTGNLDAAFVPCRFPPLRSNQVPCDFFADYTQPGRMIYDLSPYGCVTDVGIAIVAGGGAALNATSIPLSAAIGAVIPPRTVLIFGSGKVARTSAPVNPTATSLPVEALPVALLAGDTAYYIQNELHHAYSFDATNLDDGNTGMTEVAGGTDLPIWVPDAGVPFGVPVQSCPLPNETIPAPVTPGGGPYKRGDSFGRRNQTFGTHVTPTLGNDEGGTLARAAWVPGITGGYTQRQTSLVGILGGRAHFLDNGPCVAYLPGDSGVDFDLSVDREPAKLRGETGLSFRVLDKDNYFGVYYYNRDVSRLFIFFFQGGAGPTVVTTVDPNKTWTTLSLTDVGNTITIRVDGVQQIQLSNATLKGNHHAGICNAHQGFWASSEASYKNFIWR